MLHLAALLSLKPVNERSIRNLVLIGFMGTGKSTVGRLIAAQLGYTFVDTDHLIESRAGKSISEIFAQSGEGAFRAFEREMVADLKGFERAVVATGGGLGADPDNLASLKAHACVICLWASPKSILDRVGQQTHRPMLQSPNPLERINQLLAVRDPVYRLADALINTENRSVKEVAQQVVHQFHIVRHGSA